MKDEGPIILLAGNGPYANRGCEAIVRGTTKVLHDLDPSIQFISSYFQHPGCDDALNEINNKIQHRSFPRFKPFTLNWIKEQMLRRFFNQPINALNVRQVFQDVLGKVEIVLMLGGDNYTLDYGSHRIFFLMNELVIESGKPLVIWGASIGPFSDDRGTERRVARALQHVYLIAARETETVNYLKGIGVNDNVVLTADPAFCLQSKETQLPDAIEEALKEGAIGVNLSPLLHRFMHSIPHGSSSLNRWVDISSEILSVIQEKIPNPLILIPHVTSYQGDIFRDDYLFLRMVKDRITKSERILLLGNDLNAAESKEVIGRLRVFAGARTHSTIAAISSCVPTICIGYSMKARGIAKDTYGSLNWLIDNQLLMAKPELLAHKLLELLSREKEVRKQLARKVPMFQNRVHETATAIIQLLT